MTRRCAKFVPARDGRKLVLFDLSKTFGNEFACGKPVAPTVLLIMRHSVMTKPHIVLKHILKTRTKGNVEIDRFKNKPI